MLYAVATIPFALAAGAVISLTNVDVYDLSRAKAVRLELKLTGAGAAEAGDTLDIYLQEATGYTNTVWHDRAHFAQMNGAMTVSAAAPEERVIQFSCVAEPRTATDGSYEPSGSAGAARLGAGAYIPGALLGKLRGANGIIPRYRFRFEQVDGNSNAAFAGSVLMFIDGEG